jgi:uncharacterized membrane protein YagU involved in acid resistance
MGERQPREIDWSVWLVRGALGGIAAGGAFLTLTMWFATSVGDPAKAPLLMISTIVKGDDAMMNGSASLSVGLAVHVGLSAVFGLVFAALAKRVKTNGALAIAGALYGAALYLLNFKVLTPLAFPVFKMANQPFELVVHLVFGSLLSFAHFRVSMANRASSLRTT